MFVVPEEKIDRILMSEILFYSLFQSTLYPNQQQAAVSHDALGKLTI